MKTIKLHHILSMLLCICIGMPVAKAFDATKIQKADNCVGGLQIVIGNNQTDFAVELSKTGKFDTQIIITDVSGLQTERNKIADINAGSVVSVVADENGFTALPYVDNLLNRVVICDLSSAKDEIKTVNEIVRILAPLGTAYADIATGNLLEKAGLKASGKAGNLFAYTKPWPDDIDEWTHWTHSANGNAVAKDQKVGPPRHYQWFNEPRWQRSHESASSTSAIVSARGKIYTITDFAPPSLFGPTFAGGEWYLTAQDAFNGQYLWKIPIKEWGWEYWQLNWFMDRSGDFPLNRQKRLVAVDGKVYVTLGFRAPVSQIDGNTGNVLKRFEGTEGTNELIVKDGMLIAAVLNAKDNAKYRDRKKGEEAGTAAKIMAFDIETGKEKWTSNRGYKGAFRNYVGRHDATMKYNLINADPAASIATDGKTVALSDGNNIVALNFNTGEEMWSVKRLDSYTKGIDRDKINNRLTEDTPFVREIMANQKRKEDERIAAAREGPVPEKWIGSIMVVDDVVLQGNPTSLIAFDAKTGTQLWEVEKWWIHHLWYAWQENFVIDGLVWTWGETVVGTLDPPYAGRITRALLPATLNAYDIKTGELKRSIDTKSLFLVGHHHRCYRNKATEKFLIASHRGVEMINMEDESLHADTWLRSMCHIGFMPANGLLNALPHPCICYLEEKVEYMVAFASESVTPAPLLSALAPERLTKGNAYGYKGRKAKLGDWPAFRHNNARSGATRSRVGENISAVWTKKVGVKPTAPIAVNGLIFFGDTKANQVTALKQNNGDIVWKYIVGGPVNSPPAYSNGKVYFGSQDGYVYCLKASTGELVWKFLAAKNNRQMCAIGKFESVNPVIGSVMIDEDNVYVSAGRSSNTDGGVQLYALNAETGAVNNHNDITGPFTDFNTFEKSRDYNIPRGQRPDVMMKEPGSSEIFMLNVGFDENLQKHYIVDRGRTKAPTIFGTMNGFLDDQQFKRSHWNFKGGYANLVSYDDSSLYAFRMFESVRALTSEVFFTPGTKGYTLQRYIREGEKNEPGWKIKLPVRATAMLTTPGQIFLAGVPDFAPDDDPFASFKGKLGAELYVVDIDTKGEKKQVIEIAAAPVFNGIATTPGKLFLTLENGEVMMFKGK